MTENNPNRPVYENIKLLKLPKKIISFIPLVWSLLSYFTLIWLYENRHTNSIQFVIGGVVVIIVLTFIRQVVTLRENHKLTNELENEVENIKKELSEDYAFQNELLTDLDKSENK